MTLLNHPKPCNINGMAFASLADAARHFDVTPQAISALIKRKGSYTIEGYEPTAKDCSRVIDGVRYKSIASASRMLKIPYEKLYAMLKEERSKPTIDRK